MTLDEANTAIEQLQRRDAIRKLLYINSIRRNPQLASEPNYRIKFNGYYKLRQQRKGFYDTFYDALSNAAIAPEEANLSNLLQKFFDACGQRHLSFCSKLLATVRDDAIVFDKNVAKYFGVDSSALPRFNWIEVAQGRYNEIQIHISKFLMAPTWPRTSASFDKVFPEAAYLPDVRKADLIIWAHVGLLLSLKRQGAKN